MHHACAGWCNRRSIAAEAAAASSGSRCSTWSTSSSPCLDSDVYALQAAQHDHSMRALPQDHRLAIGTRHYLQSRGSKQHGGMGKPHLGFESMLRYKAALHPAALPLSPEITARQQAPAFVPPHLELARQEPQRLCFQAPPPAGASCAATAAAAAAVWQLPAAVAGGRSGRPCLCPFLPAGPAEQQRFLLHAAR